MKRAVCSGSFDPVTKGHLDIFARAARLVDELVVCVFTNRLKHALFTPEERVNLLREVTAGIDNLRVDVFDGLLVDYLRTQDINLIIRGLRSAADLTYETSAARMNKHLYPKAETVFLLAAPEYTFVSSSAVKEVAAFGGDIAALVPPEVAAAVKAKYNNL